MEVPKMARISTRSNPTNLIEIDKKRIGISLAEISGKQYFRFTRLDLDGLDLPSDALLICVARAGNNSYQRYDLGTVSLWKRDNLPLDSLDLSGSVRFRLLVHAGGDPQLLASAEKLRPVNEAESESILPMEPAELGELIWVLEVTEEGPVLKFNSRVFPNAAGAESYLPFASVVLPEALRTILKIISDEPEKLDDENDSFSVWKNWLIGLGMGNVPADETERNEWCDDVIQAFCRQHMFATRLIEHISTGGSD
jgi:hypothetical protein